MLENMLESFSGPVAFASVPIETGGEMGKEGESERERDSEREKEREETDRRRRERRERRKERERKGELACWVYCCWRGDSGGRLARLSPIVFEADRWNGVATVHLNIPTTAGVPFLTPLKSHLVHPST